MSVRPVLATALILLVLSGCAARANAAEPAGLPAGVGVAPLRQADAVRASLAMPGYEAKIRGLLGATGATAPATPAIPLPSSGDLALTARLPAGLRVSVAGLVAAVRRADSMLGPLPRSQVDRDLGAAVASAGRLVPETAASAPAPGRDGRLTPVLPRSVSPGRAVARAVRNAPAAALLLASALDRYLPAVRADAPPPGPPVQGCDVASDLPLLCIGGPGDNTYTEQAALMIDQGGDDTYRSAAGGAPFLPPGGPAYVPVSVVIDQGGDDLYAPPNAAPWSYTIGAFTYSLEVADGAGVSGGVGLVVDQGGDDVHRAAAPVVGAAKAALAVAQGAGMGGIGAILDQAGNDSYSVTAPSGTQNGVTVLAQGASLMNYRVAPQTNPPLPGVDVVPAGGLVDQGSGDDTYSIAAGQVRSNSDAGFQGYRGVLGQGYALLGSGVLSDDGGTDHLTATASASRGDRLTYPGPSESYAAPSVQINAQGYGLGPVFGNTTVPKGFGLVLEGEGDTTYRIAAPSRGMASNMVWGQAFAGGDGWATVDDRGGNDAYSVSSSLAMSRTVKVGDGCKMPDGSICPAARATIDASRLLFTNWVQAQGAGGVTGEAIVRDHQGDDTYSVAATGTLQATLRDRLSHPRGPATLDVTSYGPMALGAQGYTGLGEGALIDEAGTDAYTARYDTTTVARATSLNGPKPQVTALASAKGAAAGQGAGAWFIGSTQLGALLDLGGSGDRFTATVSNTASAFPTRDGGLQAGSSWPQGFQGNGFQGLLVANGDDPHIFSSPAQGVCPLSQGYRGFGDWSFCGMQGSDPDHQVFDGIPAFLAPIPAVLAQGHAPNAFGAAPSLSFGAATPSQGKAETRVPVSALLLGPDGKPKAGAPVRFDIQAVFAGSIVDDPRFEVFDDIWEATATTDASGVATATLPLAFARLNWDPTGDQFRLMATYSGADGLYPAHTVKDFTVEP